MLPSLELDVEYSHQQSLHLPEFVRGEGSPDIPHHIMVAGHEVLVLPGPHVLLALGNQLGVAAHGTSHRLHQPLVSLHVSTRVRDSVRTRVCEGTGPAPAPPS